jgi:HEAT repeats
MIQPPLEILKSAVIILGLSTLGSAVAIYLLMEIHYRRQLARQARRIILGSRLSPAPAEQEPEIFWSKSSRRDREIILDILVDQSTLSEAKWQNAIKQMLIGLGVFDRWQREVLHGSVAERVRAATRLGSIRDPRGIAALVSAAGDASWQVRLAAALALGRLKDPEGVPGLIRVAQNPVRAVPDLTLAAALAACAEGKPSLLADLIASPEPRLRIMASWALSEIADRSVLDQLLDVAGDPDPEVRAKSARALARVHDHGAVAALMRLARDPVWFVRVRAMDALGELRDVAGEEAAFQGLEDPVREVRSRAAFALRQMRGMKGEVAAKVLATSSRRGFNSLISEWDRAGFLWEVVKGLSTRHWGRYQESLRTVRILIDAGVTRTLANFILVSPDLKVRLRLARLFLESSSVRVKAEIRAVAKHPGCHRLVAQKIDQTFPDAAPASVGPTRAAKAP